MASCKTIRHLQELIAAADDATGKVAEHALAIVVDMQSNGARGADLHFLHIVLDFLYAELEISPAEHLMDAEPDCDICPALKTRFA